MENKLENTLKWIVNILHKHNITFQISGGFAASIYGAKRPVNDIDIDVPEDKMELLIPDIKKYIVFGPTQHKDERWDLKLIYLEYNGQEIDIGGGFNTMIFDDQKKEWLHFPVNFKTSQIHEVFGMKIPVVDPHDLIEYKRLLSGDHQKLDISAIEEYISKHN